MARPAIAVIGAGVVGCLAARELAAADPAARITVLDRDAIGAGASRRSAGLHLPRGATPMTRRMSAFSHAYYARLREQHPELPIYPVGAKLITDYGHGDLSDSGYIKPAAAHPVIGGVPHPEVRLPAGTRAWQIAGAHYADVPALTQAIAARLRPRVRFAEGVAVTGLTAGAGSVTVHCATGEQVLADQVVLAPGPWLAVPAWRDLVAPLRLRVKKIVALHIERRPAQADEAVIFDAEDAFLLPLAHRGHWLFSYTCTEWDVDPDALTCGLSAANIKAARDCLRRYSPALAAACRAGRVFCDAYSTDGEPQVRAIDEAGRIVFAGGASGSGYRLAPAIGAQVAALALRDDPQGLLRSSEGVAGDYQHV